MMPQEPEHCRWRDGRRMAASPFSRTAGLAIVMPGLIQLSWRQHDRGMVFLGTFASCLGTSLFCWGRPLGWGLLILACLTHVAASMDVQRQRAFPVFPGKVSLCVTVLGMSLAVYLPLMFGLYSCALPTRPDAKSGVSYLVNCWAYKVGDPSPGQWIWLRLSPASAPRVGQVVAVAGQEVRWTGHQWRVDGKSIRLRHPGTLPDYPEAWEFRVPADHVLCGPEAADSASDASGFVIVAREQIVGQAWARYHPFWKRRLL
jgi:Signal peptidase, peptidase S26